jgi:hypothetical protein
VKYTFEKFENWSKAVIQSNGLDTDGGDLSTHSQIWPEISAACVNAVTNDRPWTFAMLPGKTKCPTIKIDSFIKRKHSRRDPT